jgi:exodeoxyribonuclease VII large subunit
LPRPLDLLATARQRVDLASTRLGAALRAFQHRKAIALAAVAPRLSHLALRQSFDREARQFDTAATRLAPAVARVVADRQRRLAGLVPRLSGVSLRQSYDREARRLGDVGRRLDSTIERQLAERGQRLESYGKLLNSLGYRGVLARGYAVVTDQDGNLIRSAAIVAGGQSIGIEFADGSVAAHVDSEYKLPPLRQRRKRSAPTTDNGQQSLF